MNEKSFVDWMSNEPNSEVMARMRVGNFKLLGLSLYRDKNAAFAEIDMAEIQSIDARRETWGSS